MHYIGGLLKHGPALLAFAAPTVNSYRRLVPGFEAPVNLVYSQRNRSAAIRIPTYSKSEKSKRIEFRCPDTAANPYLPFAALLMAGLDGVKNKIDPGAPADFDLYEASAEELAKDQEHAGLAARGARPRSRTTTTSCSKAVSSPRTSSTPGSSYKLDERDRAGQPAPDARTSSTSTSTSRFWVFGAQGYDLQATCLLPPRISLLLLAGEEPGMRANDPPAQFSRAITSLGDGGIRSKDVIARRGPHPQPLSRAHERGSSPRVKACFTDG